MSDERIEWYGYLMEVETSTHDGRYHDTQRTVVRIVDPSSEEVIHTVSASSRSNHQLNKQYRPAAGTREGALDEARSWVLSNCPRAQELRAAERAREFVEARHAALNRYQELGRDMLAFVLELPYTVTATRLAEILGIGSARRANKLLLEWGLQTKDSSGYWPVENRHAEIRGFHNQMLWTTAGLKSAWDAGIEHGLFSGGDEEFLRRVQDRTSWFDFLSEHA